MPPEILSRQFDSESSLTVGEVVDVNRSEQVAFLLPSSEVPGQDDKKEVFIAINPLTGNASEVHKLLEDLEHDLHKDFPGIPMDTKQSYTTMAYADETGILEMSDPDTNKKIDRMDNGEIPGKLPSMSAIQLSADRDVIDNPLFAQATAALIGKRLESLGEPGEAWMENLTGSDGLEPVCIRSGDYSLTGAFTEEHGTHNVDKSIREEVANLQEDRLEVATVSKDVGALSTHSVVEGHDRRMDKTRLYSRARDLVGRISVRGGDNHSPRAIN